MKFCPEKYPWKKKKTGIRSFAAAQSDRSIQRSTRHLQDRKQLVRRTSVNLWTAEAFASVSWSFGALEDCEWLSFYAAPAELVTRHRFPTGLRARKIGRRNWHRFKIPYTKIQQRDHLRSRGKNIAEELLRRSYLIKAAFLKIRYPIQSIRMFELMWNNFDHPLSSRNVECRKRNGSGVLLTFNQLWNSSEIWKFQELQEFCCWSRIRLYGRSKWAVFLNSVERKASKNIIQRFEILTIEISNEQFSNASSLISRIFKCRRYNRIAGFVHF